MLLTLPPPFNCHGTVVNMGSRFFIVHPEDTGHRQLQRGSNYSGSTDTTYKHIWPGNITTNSTLANWMCFLLQVKGSKKLKDQVCPGGFTWVERGNGAYLPLSLVYYDLFETKVPLDLGILVCLFTSFHWGKMCHMQQYDKYSLNI